MLASEAPCSSILKNQTKSLKPGHHIAKILLFRTHHIQISTTELTLVSNIQATAYNGGFMVFYWNWRKIKYDFINILTPYCVVECSNCRGSFLLCKWSICLLEIGTKKSNFSRVHLVRLCFYFKFATSPFLSIPKQNSKKKTQKVTNRKLFIFQSAL